MGGFIPGKSLVHVSGQCFDESERYALAEVAGFCNPSVDGTSYLPLEPPPLQLTAGRLHAELERALAKRFGVKHARLVNSGSSANLLALAALNLPPGSEVITVACAFPTTVAPIVQLGLVPVFVDVGLDGNVDVTQLEAAYSEKTRAVMLAHALGFPFDLGKVIAFCGNHGLKLVADCCDAAGATWQGMEVPALGDVSTLSFYPAHQMTTGEGGCVLTDDDQLATVITSLRDWGRDCHCPPGHDNTCGARFSQSREVLGDLPAGYDHKYVYRHLGWNLKMTEMQAAIGLVQLSKLDGFIRRRQETWGFYLVRLLEEEGAGRLVLPHIRDPSHAQPSPFGFLLVAKSAEERRRIVGMLEAARIQTRPLFAGNLLRHPAMRGVKFGIAGGSGGTLYVDTLDGLLPVTDRLADCAFWIGVYPGVTDEMRDYVVKVLREVCR
jgi:CDP-4-dehydro-6-deoxyglucose reductase, E1